MGGKQAKPIVEVAAVHQKLARSELVYLKNLFLVLVQSAAAPGPASSSSPAGSSAVAGASSHLNQSLSSAALANPSNLELMALRLPKDAAITFLLAPAFPGISHALAEKFFQIFDYLGYGSGLDYSEFLVMVWTLWYGANDELARFFFQLFDAATGSGRIGKKEYRKVAQMLLEEYLPRSESEAHGLAAGRKEKKASTNVAAPVHPSAATGGESRDHLLPLLDFYFHLSLYLYDRDHDKLLSPKEFAQFADEDLLIRAMTTGRMDPRQAKQRVREMLGARGDHLMPSSRPNSPVAAALLPALAVASPALPPRRTFLGEEEVEPPSGEIWKQLQRRSHLRPQVKQTPTAASSTTNTAGTPVPAIASASQPQSSSSNETAEAH